MTRPWQPEPEPVAVAEPALLTHIRAVWAGLHALGMIKPGEQWLVSHQYDCPTARPAHDYALCNCPGGPELFFSDWDELQPIRHRVTPERFYDKH